MSGLLSKAIEIATEAHKCQVDKGGNDYILHPLRVMETVKTEKEKIVAVLHDALEDTTITPEYLLEEGFSMEIVNAILDITRKDDEGYMDFIHRVKQNPISKQVKLADLKDNMDLSRISNPTENDYRRVKKYRRAMNELLMHNVVFKYKHRDLVGVKFDDNDIYIGEVESFRFTENNSLPLYKVENVGLYLPETMLFDLTEEQKEKYRMELGRIVNTRNKIENEYRNLAKEILK